MKEITFNVFGRFGKSHGHYYGDIVANTAKEAFKIAVNKYFMTEHYISYTEFYVWTPDQTIDSNERGYGYDIFGQQNYSYFRTSLKQIIDSMYEEK